jgi:ATP-dependent helicase/nuclease subunit A
MVLKSAVSAHQKPENDATLRQQMASNPLESVWVGASAGTGKTKVLTDRVLRLLLPREDGAPGTPAHRILCLTFTKAAASEMALRINQTLGAWAVLDLENLKAKLEGLLGQAPRPDQIAAAQRLFANVMDTAGGLQIMTIHSFCQSVLGRFPLEASLPPNFTLLEEAQALELIAQAKAHVLEKAQNPGELADALGRIGRDIDEKAFAALIREIAGERHQMAGLLRGQPICEVYAAICGYYDISPQTTEGDVMGAFCANEAFAFEGLGKTAQTMQDQGGKTSLAYSAVVMSWLKSNQSQRINNFKAYKDVFITTKGTAREKDFPVLGVKALYPDAEDILRAESQRILTLQDKLSRMKSAALTRDILTIGQEILSAYADLKRLRGGLDFDDLILRTMDLLRGETGGLQGFEDAGAWIMYKLDQGLDHILVDEAQDTNPEQWRIIEALCDEFFRGMGAKEHMRRSSFVVGDIKQSIYSFQRAAPEEFQRMQTVFERKIREAGQTSRNIPLETSFRSTQSVLRLVDRVFAEPMLNAAVGGGEIHHIAHRAGQAGCAELWPLIENEAQEKADPWAPPLAIREQKSAAARMASTIAERIAQWLAQGEMLHSAGRPLQAGDIMILVRSRSAFVDQLVRALKLKSIPVSGVDRMRLGEQLVVQDMLSMARFALLPEDDLNLACVLKSPFVGWDEEDLFALCYQRAGSLWSELQYYDAAKFKDKTDGPYPELLEQKRVKALEYLKNFIHIAQAGGSYEFFSALLQKTCPADSVSGLRAIKGRLGEDALDPMEELLNAALSFGRENIDSLQLFLAQQEHKSVDIKRELEESGGKVRIMTVHGSKGLQAPIVIIPDTIKTAQSRKISRLLWPKKTGLAFPLWSPRKDDDPVPYRNIYEKGVMLAGQEEGRLLYVAMTRAADRLYVAGYKQRNGSIEDSWYEKVCTAFDADDATQKDEEGVLRLENPQTAAPDQTDKAQQKLLERVEVPLWLSQPAPQEPSPPRPLVPSRPSITEQQSALSPLAAGHGFRFKRGNLTHKLLQFLPEFAPETREKAAQYYLEKNADDLPADVQQNIADEVLKILDNPDYSQFFSNNSRAEVSVTGLMPDNRIISGQIDRLVVGEKDIWILDYKTNRPPPTDPKDIPHIYRAQLAAYRDTIVTIYPQHKIHCALLWTDGPRLMIVE